MKIELTTNTARKIATILSHVQPLASHENQIAIQQYFDAVFKPGTYVEIDIVVPPVKDPPDHSDEIVKRWSDPT